MAHRETDTGAIGQRIATAREDVGFTQAELASQVGLDRTAVAKIESGRRKISATELVRLAASLDRPVDWFVVESPPAVVSRREDPAAGGQSRLLDRRIERLARDVEFLEAEGVLPPVEPCRLEMPESFEQAEVAATKTRAWMSAEPGPLLDFQQHCETVGLLAFSLSLGDEGRDGAYVAVDNWGVALINGAVDPGRRRFNLAHELGHHVFADAYAPEVTISPGSETERMINAFAIHLLLPRESVEEVWRGFEDPRLAAVAVGVRFRASWTAVCSQLKNLGLIGERQRADLAADPPTGADFVELGESWVSELDPPAIPPEYGRRVLAAYRTGRLTASRTTELLWGTVREEELPERHEIPLEGLRREFDALP
jgi:Zn-dependent peptidase ImmA (M78 family)/transcriptional regulator with XRE-family HTH domain